MSEFPWLDWLMWGIVALFAAGGFFLGWKNKDGSGYWGKADALSKVARDAVAAAQQLWDSGQIPAGSSKEILYDKAVDWIQEMLPWVTDDMAEMAVENAVYWLKKSIEVHEKVQDSPTGGTVVQVDLEE